MRVLDLIQRSEVPEGETAKHKIERFTVSPEASSFDRLRSAINYSGRYCPPGTYTRLIRGNKRAGSFGCTVVMSDTPDEMRDHYAPVAEARGHCLLNGLGLGMVAEACLRKPEVEKVTVIENNPEVIELVAPYLREKWGERIEIIEADAFTYKPPRGTRYGMVWHDIWDYICADNLPEMTTLHRRYARRTDWQGSWCRAQCRRHA